MLSRTLINFLNHINTNDLFSTRLVKTCLVCMNIKQMIFYSILWGRTPNDGEWGQFF